MDKPRPLFYPATMSRASLIQVYLDSLPFCRLAIVQTAGGCRVAVGGELAPGEAAVATIYLKSLHVELTMNAASLGDGQIDQPPDAVAERILHAAKAIGAPYETATELRAVAERQVDEIIERVRATNQAGGLSALNKAYKQYRRTKSTMPSAQSDTTHISSSTIRSESCAASHR